MQSSTNSAKRRYLRGLTGVMIAYAGLVASSTISVRHWHPAGWHVFLAAALPTIPILCLAYIVGRYLREEKDEYQRDLVVRGLLWGTSVALSLSVFSSFLRAYGMNAGIPPFTEFAAFWVTVALVTTAQTLANRGGDDD
jgi:hypothetical protein